jgi:phage baseplate assembly protein W
MSTKPRRIWTDIDALFLRHPTTNDLTIKSDDRAIKFAVKSLVMTTNYERLFHGEIGTPIKRFLFEQLDDINIIIIREAIADVINNYEPRVTVIDVIVNPDEDNNKVSINIVYRIKNSNSTSSVSITLDRSR